MNMLSYSLSTSIIEASDYTANQEHVERPSHWSKVIQHAWFWVQLYFLIHEQKICPWDLHKFFCCMQVQLASCSAS
jgi:hypothetical protein